jgi:hypothetical protein
VTEFRGIWRVKALKPIAEHQGCEKPNGYVPKENAPLGDRRYAAHRIKIANRDIPSAMETLAASWKKSHDHA